MKYIALIPIVVLVLIAMPGAAAEFSLTWTNYGGSLGGTGGSNYFTTSDGYSTVGFYNDHTRGQFFSNSKDLHLGVGFQRGYQGQGQYGAWTVTNAQGYNPGNWGFYTHRAGNGQYPGGAYFGGHVPNYGRPAYFGGYQYYGGYGGTYGYGHRGTYGGYSFPTRTGTAGVQGRTWY